MFTKIYFENKEKQKIKFIEENEEHQKILISYWNLLNDNKKPFERKSKVWSDFGFQGVDPITDLRGSGLLSLQNLHFFVQFSPAAYHKTLQISDHFMSVFSFLLFNLWKIK